MTAGRNADERLVEQLVDAAVEILIERVLLTVVPPKHPTSWRERVRGTLHLKHDARAFELLAGERLDGVSARTLADWLDPPSITPAPPAPTPREAGAWWPSELYADAERRRRERFVGGWLAQEVHDRCIARARAELDESTARAVEKETRS